MSKDKLLRHHPAERHAEYVRALDSQRIKQRGGVIRHIGNRKWILRLIRSSDATVIKRDHAEVGRESVNLRFETFGSAAESADQKQRLPVAVLLVIHLEARCLKGRQIFPFYWGVLVPNWGAAQNDI